MTSHQLRQSPVYLISCSRFILSLLKEPLASCQSKASNFKVANILTGYDWLHLGLIWWIVLESRSVPVFSTVFRSLLSSSSMSKFCLFATKVLRKPRSIETMSDDLACKRKRVLKSTQLLWIKFSRSNTQMYLAHLGTWLQASVASNTFFNSERGFLLTKLTKFAYRQCYDNVS